MNKATFIGVGMAIFDFIATAFSLSIIEVAIPSISIILTNISIRIAEKLKGILLGLAIITMLARFAGATDRMGIT